MPHIHSPLAILQPAIYHGRTHTRTPIQHNASGANRHLRYGTHPLTHRLAIYPSRGGVDPLSSRGDLEPLYADLFWSRFDLD